MKTANNKTGIRKAAIVLLTVIMAFSGTGCLKKMSTTRVPVVDADTFMAQCESSLGWTRAYSITTGQGQYYYCSDRVQLEPNQVSYFTGSDANTFIIRVEYTNTEDAAAAFTGDYDDINQRAAMAGTHDDEYETLKKDNYGYVVVHPDKDDLDFYYTLHVYFRDNVYVYMVVYGDNSSAVEQIEDLIDELDYPD